jgi:maltose-binding protein MalE
MWSGILAKYAEDLSPAFSDLHDMLPTLVENDTVNRKLIAVPYFIEVSPIHQLLIEREE